MKKIISTLRHWFTLARMGSEDLATLTLPHWVLVALDFKTEVKQDYVGLIAAGVAFYFLLAAFPAMAAAVSIFGLVADPVIIQGQLSMLAQFLPPEAFDILMGQIASLTGATHQSLSLGLIISLVFTLYSATRGTAALIKGLNIAYNATERRNLFKRTFLSYGLTLIMLVHFLMSLAMIAAVPVAINIIPMPALLADILRLIRWPLLFILAVIGLEILYTFGPNRKRKKITLSAGAVVATLLWLGGSSLFSMFVNKFTDFNETYGSLGAVIILMLWFWVSALTILIGAEINGVLEKNAKK